MANPGVIHDIALQDSLRPSSPRSGPTTANDGSEHRNRQRELDRKRVLALIGSALSQLPIWGKSGHPTLATPVSQAKGSL